PAPDIPARLVPLSPPTRPPSPSPSLASFSWHAAPRALPSFPTRRSSDLRLDAQPRRASAGDHPVLCGQCRSATTGLAGAPEPSGLERPPERGTPRAGRPRAPRKARRADHAEHRRTPPAGRLVPGHRARAARHHPPNGLPAVLRSAADARDTGPSRGRRSGPTLSAVWGHLEVRHHLVRASLGRLRARPSSSRRGVLRPDAGGRHVAVRPP